MRDYPPASHCASYEDNGQVSKGAVRWPALNGIAHRRRITPAAVGNGRAAAAIVAGLRGSWNTTRSGASRTRIALQRPLRAWAKSLCPNTIHSEPDFRNGDTTSATHPAIPVGSRVARVAHIRCCGCHD